VGIDGQPPDQAVAQPTAPGRRRGVTLRLIFTALGVAVILLTVLFIVFAPKPGTTTVSGGPATVGRLAPDFVTPTLDGQSIRLSQFRGKPVLVNFWATWCTACRAEMPAIERVWERHRAQGFQVVEVDYQELNQAAMRSFLRDVGVHFGSALDPDGKIAAAYGVTIGLPDSIFIDRHGIIRVIHLGEMSPDYIEHQVLGIL
jgi:cytochrome c biogenesis protein CcmG, thiol:disulfide interchange protein DsbE